MRRRLLVLSALLAAVMYAHPLAQAEDVDDDSQTYVGYRAPAGFQGHPWGEPVRAFADFEADPLYVQTAFSRGKTTLVDMQCISRGTLGCDLEASLRTLDQNVEGEGFHTLAEYYVDSQGVQFTETQALLSPVFYQFCAHWGGSNSKLPADIRERLKFCGMRMLFRSETPEEIAALPQADDYVTNYDRVLWQLIRMHGEPEDYDGRGRVIITTTEETIALPRAPRRQPRFDEWRWCSLHTDREIAPNCGASIVLAFDAKSGWGVVLYATKPIWEFAYARHQGGAEDDPLFKLLTGLDQQRPADHACTGTHLCRPGPPHAMRQDALARFRLQPR